MRTFLTIVSVIEAVLDGVGEWLGDLQKPTKGGK